VATRADRAAQERLDLDLNADGSIMSVVIHFFGRELVGPACDQVRAYVRSGYRVSTPQRFSRCRAQRHRRPTASAARDVSS
jgi:hypothetical protein